jgi:hypothetical protein
VGRPIRFAADKYELIVNQTTSSVQPAAKTMLAAPDAAIE